MNKDGATGMPCWKKLALTGSCVLALSLLLCFGLRLALRHDYDTVLAVGSHLWMLLNLLLLWEYTGGRTALDGWGLARYALLQVGGLHPALLSAGAERDLPAGAGAARRRAAPAADRLRADAALQKDRKAQLTLPRIPLHHQKIRRQEAPAAGVFQFSWLPPHSTSVKPRRSGAVSCWAGSSTGSSSGFQARKTRSTVSGAGSTVNTAESV